MMKLTLSLICFWSCASLCMTELKLSHLSTLYLPYQVTPSPKYGFASKAVEQMTYNPSDKFIYAIGKGIIHIVNASDATRLQSIDTFENPDYDYTDIEVCGDHVFLAVDNMVNRTEGLLLVFEAYDPMTSEMRLVHTIKVGVIPDMIYPRHGCRSVFVAVEAEAYEDASGTFQDPESAVVIVTFPQGAQGNYSIESLDFRKFNDRISTLLPSGVRFVYRQNNNTFSADAEPEYIAIDEEKGEAFISLQENNAIATVDLQTHNITGIYGLGYKEWGHLDTSDKDGGIRISYWPIRSWYLPDAIKFHHWKGHRLLFTANEGDTKDYGNQFNEEIKGKHIDVNTQLSDKIHPMIKSALMNDSLLGRLTMSKYDGLNSNGQYDALYTFGGRSFSIWDADTMTLLFDSGSDMEDLTALHCPHTFNAQFYTYLEPDVRSDNKGPETEALAIAELHGRLFIFVGNERPGNVVVYSIGNDVTKPRFESIHCDGIPDSRETVTQMYSERKLYLVDPEDLRYYPGPKSPTGHPVLFSVGSVSATISVFNVTYTPSSQDDSPTKPEPEPEPKKCEGNSASSLHLGSGLLLNAAVLYLLQVFITRH